MFDLIANLLSFFYNINDSYVFAIVMLTFVVLVISTPLTLQGTRSMLKMQLLQPELKEIQSRYGKEEREEMNAEMMEFYKTNNINPVGGCIPMLFQIPVFLVLYRVILGITRRATDVGSQFGIVAGSIRSGEVPAVYDSSERAAFNPAYVSDDSDLYDSLTSENEMISVGFDISRSASQVLGDGVIDSLPYLALVLVVGLSGWFQHQMIRKRQTGAPVNPTQEMIMKFMPFFLPVFSFSLPAAIVFYFLVSNVYRIGQQYYITRSMYHGEDSLGGQLRKNRENGDGDSKAGGSKGGSKSGGSKGGGSKGGGSKNNGSRGGGSKGSGSKGSGSKGSGSKGSGSKGSGSKAGGSKSSNSAKRNGSNGARKKTTTKNKSKTSTASRTSAPGRNSSGRQASARATVQPKARKKKKR